MSPETPFDPALRRRNRIMLVALALLFLLPVGAATVLHLSGWRPAHTRNHGELLAPPVALGGLALQQADGTAYPWAPRERRWHIAVVPPADCGAQCTELVAGLGKVWQLQGRRADRLNVLWFGPVPEDAALFRTFVPMRPNAELSVLLPGLATSGAPSLYLIDPTGFLVMRYTPGFDLAKLRADVTQLLK